jgi:hypothetical protein
MGEGYKEIKHLVILMDRKPQKTYYLDTLQHY